MGALEEVQFGLNELQASDAYKTLVKTKSWKTTHIYHCEQHLISAISLLTPVTPQLRLGFTGHLGLWRFPTAKNSDALSLATKLGGLKTGLIRDDLYPGSSAEQITRLVACAKAGNFRLSLVLSGNNGKRDPATHATGTVALLKAVAAEAAKQGIQNPVAYVEPMNEPNSGNAYANDPTGYAALCTAITRAVRPLNMGIKVMGGSTNGPGNYTWDGPLTWLESVLSAGCEFDEWCTHGYYFTTGITVDQMFRMDVATSWNKIFWFRNAKSPETVEDVLTRFGYKGPIHIGETGCPTDAYPSGVRVNTTPSGTEEKFGTTSETVQAQWFPRAWSMWFAQERAGWFMPYEAMDGDSANTNNREQHFGMYHTDGTKKPIVDAILAIV